MRTAKLFFAAVAAVAAFLFCVPVYPADYTYDGGDTYNKYDWTRPTNWQYDLPPGFGGSVDMAGWSVGYVTGTVGSVTLAGGGISVNGNSPGTFAIGGDVYGPGTIGNAFDISTGIKFNNAGGTLTLGTIYSNGYTPTFTGGGTTNFYMSGAGGLILDSGTLKGYGSYTGDTTISGGTFKLTGGVGYGGSVPGKIAISDGGTLQTFYDGYNVSSTLGEITGAGRVENNNGYGSNGYASFKVGSLNSNFQFDGVIAGTGGFTKIGSGTMTLDNLEKQCTYTGETVIDNGTLVIKTSDKLQSTSAVKINQGVLDIYASNAVNSAASLNMGYSGTAKLILSAAQQKFSSLSGNSVSTIFINTPAGGSTAGLSVDSGSFSGSITGNGQLTKSGTAGTLVLLGSNSYTGKTYISGGTLQLAPTSVMANDIEITNNGTLYFDYSGPGSPTTFAADITGAGGVISRAQYAPLTLTGINNWTGTTYVQTGTLKLLQGIGTGAPLNVAGTLDLNNVNSAIGAVTGSGIIQIGTSTLTLHKAADDTQTGTYFIYGTTGGVTKAGSGKLMVDASRLSYAGLTTVSAGTWVGATPAQSTLAVAGGAVFQGGSAGAITGEGTIISSGHFSCGANGQSTGFSGTVDIGSNTFSKSGAGKLSLNAGAVLKAAGVAITAGELAFGTGSLLWNTTPPTLTMYSGSTLSLLDGIYEFGNLPSTGFGTVNIGTDATFEIHNTSNGTYGGNIAGTGRFLKQGSAVLTLSGTNKFTGTTYVSFGTLNLNEYYGQTLAKSDVIVTTDGTLNTTYYSQTIGSLAGSGKVLLPANLTTGVNDHSTTFSGTMTGAYALIKAGTGEMTLNSNLDTHTGSTIAKEGVLTIKGNGSVKGSYYTQIMNGATLKLHNTLNTAMNMIGDGNLIDMYGGTLNVLQSGFTDYNESFNSTILRQGHNTVKVDNVPDLSGGISTAGIGRYAGSTFQYEDDGNGHLYLRSLPTMTNNLLPWAVVYNPDTNTHEFASVSGDTIGTYSTKGNLYTLDFLGDVSTKNVMLFGNETLSAPKTISSLTVGGSGGSSTIDGMSSLSVGNSTTTKLGAMLFNVPTTINTLALNGLGDELILFTEAPTTVNCAITGKSLVKAGSATLTLTNSNTYTGTTYVNEGTLIGPRKSIKGDIYNYATLKFDQAEDATLSNAMHGDGLYIKDNTGTLTLTASSDATGKFRIADGKLVNSTSLPYMTIETEKGAIYAASASGSAYRVVAQSDGIISPGASPGTMNVTDSVWGAGGQYIWEINDVSVSGTKGGTRGWDWLHATGNIVVTAYDYMIDLGDEIIDYHFTIGINPLDYPTNAPGSPYAFDTMQPYSWTIATADQGILGFSTNAFSFSFSDTARDMGIDGDFYVSLSSDQKSINVVYSPTPPDITYVPYTPLPEGWWTDYVPAPPIDPEPAGADVPEPSTLLLLLPFIGFGLRRLRKRRVS